MKRMILAILFLLTVSLTYAQTVPESQVIVQLLNRIGLSNEEIDTVVEIYEETELIIQEANLELNVYKAQLARLLFPLDVDMHAIEELLSTSYQWQMKRQLAQIRRQVEIRQILGNERWIQYDNLLKILQRRTAAQSATDGQSKVVGKEQDEN